jgi:EAL domain-containing protein (putative c-di-GMP-specific phosphodiesterase class I)
VYNLELDPELSLNKLGVVQISNLLGVFHHGQINDPKDKFLTVTSAQGIDEYLINNSTELIFKLSFDFTVLNQTNKSLIQELAALLKVLQLSNDEFVNTLSTFLLENGIGENLRVPLIENLVKLDAKAFKPVFVQFIMELKK